MSSAAPDRPRPAAASSPAAGGRRRWFASRAAAPGQVYGAPGQGKSTTISVATTIVLFALWFLITNMGWIKPLFLPTPQAVWDKFILAATEGVANSTLLEHTTTSLMRVFGAFLLSCVTAIPIGILMGTNRVMRGVFDPPIEFYRPLPPLAYLPLMIIWFGIGEGAKVMLLFLAIFAPVALAARAGVKSVSQEQIQAALSMGASRRQVIRHVILPGALPEILVGLRIGMGVGWTTLVAAEMVAADAGLGKMVYNASNFLRTDVVILGIVAIGVVAYAFELLMRWIERRAVPWRGRA